MSVTSLTFIAFALVTALLHALSTHAAWRNGVMLLANLLFFASFTTVPQALLPYALFLLLGFVAMKSADYSSSKAAAAGFIVVTLLIFCWLKRYFFLSALPFLPFRYLTVGLSYTFFRIMGMIIDARNDPQIRKATAIEYLNFAVNFPTLVAGPIDRYQNFRQPTELLTAPLIGQGLERIIIGFFKVIVLSTVFASWQAQGTAIVLSDASDGRRLLMSLLSFGVYPVYLYFNFSGYTDMVIGIGNLLSKRYPENFDAPFASFNFLEYWSRWHMSLSFWLRDYVYTPLVIFLMRRNPSGRLDPYLGAVGYFVTFFLIGIWHGSTVIFAIYGLLLGFGVSVNKLYQVYMANVLGKRRYRALSSNLIYKYSARGLTYAFFSFCLICFWATGAEADRIVAALGPSGLAISFVCLCVVAVILVNAWEELLAAWRRWGANASESEFMPFGRAVTMACLIFACLAYVIINHQVNSDVIYQAF